VAAAERGLMADPNVGPALTFGIALAFMGNALWYAMKVVLRRHGYRVRWFWRHELDPVNMVRLIVATRRPALRMMYGALLLAWAATIAAFVVCAVRVVQAAV